MTTTSTVQYHHTLGPSVAAILRAVLDARPWLPGSLIPHLVSDGMPDRLLAVEAVEVTHPHRMTEVTVHVPMPASIPADEPPGTLRLSHAGRPLCEIRLDHPGHAARWSVALTLPYQDAAIVAAALDAGADRLKANAALQLGFADGGHASLPLSDVIAEAPEVLFTSVRHNAMNLAARWPWPTQASPVVAIGVTLDPGGLACMVPFKPMRPSPGDGFRFRLIRVDGGG